MKKILFALIAALTTAAASAQMTFTFSNGITAETEVNPVDGSTTVTLPAGTSLSGLITAVKVDGATVDASSITPNPKTTLLEWGELEVFTYNNKAYGFRFVEDKWFCAVFISDCHTGQGSGDDGTSMADLKAITQNIIAMGKDGTQKVIFTDVDSLPTGFIPRTSIVFCTGDLDADKDNHNNFLANTRDLFKAANIPFIFIAGNHDFSPDYWTGDDPDYGATSGSGGAQADKNTLSVIKNNNSYWSSYFDNTLEYFTTGNSRSFEPQHFTFKYKGVRFYCANNYWFQKPYSGSFTKTFGITVSSATYYAPDPIISNLETFVESHKTEPSVWMQHYSFNAGSDIKRWWLDQNDKGLYIKTTNSSAYGTDVDVELYSNTGGTATEYANKKRDKLASIIQQTTNPVHFSGHYHQFVENQPWNHNGYYVDDHTCGANGRSSNTDNAYVVLFKVGEGVKAIKRAKF